MRLERAHLGRGPIGWRHLIALVLVPLIIAAGFLWSIGHQRGDFEKINAAVVNLDQPVTINGTYTPLGRQLSAELVAGPKSGNVTWTLSDPDDAAKGLTEGRYAAVVTIPEEFSKRATSFGAQASDARQAQIDVTASPSAKVVDPVIAETVTQASTRAFNRFLTENYLDNIYLGFNTMGEQFGKVADGARQLADGANQLGDGLQAADTGAQQFATGANEFAEAGGKLARAGDQVNAGTQALADGLDQMSAKTASLPQQTRALANGMGQLAQGLTQLNRHMPQLTSGVGELATGAQTYAAKVSEYTSGVQQLTGQLLPLVDGLNKELADLKIPSEKELQEYLGQAKQISEAASALGRSLQQQYQQMKQIAAHGLPVPDIPCPDELATTPGGCAIFKQGFAAGWTSGTQQIAQAMVTMMETPDPTTGLSLVQVANELTKASQSFDSLVTKVNAELKKYNLSLGQLPAELTKLRAQLDQLSQGLRGLHDGSPLVAQGAKDLSAGINQLSGGVQQLAGGVGQLDGGAGTLAQGTAALAAGMGQLSGGIASASDGANKLSSGVGQYTDGVRQYTAGGDRLRSGANQLADGMGKLNKGGAKLADGTGTLADGLEKGHKDMPHYSPGDRQTLKQVVAEPVAEPGTVTGPLSGWTAFVMMLALWLAAMATYLMVRAVSAGTLLSNKPSWRLAAESVAPASGVAAVQAVAMTAVGAALLDLSAGRTFGLLAVVTFTGITFALVNHALVAWCGGAGRIIGLVMVALFVGSALSASGPGWLDTLAVLSPLTPGMQAVQGVVTGTAMGGAIAMLMGWFTVAVVACAVAVMLRRSIGVEKYLKIAAASGH